MAERHKEPPNQPRSAARPGCLVWSRHIAGILSSAVCLSMLLPLVSLACPYSIRDVGFVDLDSIPYGLYFFLKDDTPQKGDFASTFERVSQAVLMDGNVESEIVNVDQQQSHPAIQYLRFWEIRTFPTAILLSPRGHSVVLPVFEPAKPFKETLWSALERVVSSPARDEAMDKIVRAWCVVLLVEGKKGAENASARKAVSGAIEDIARTMNRSGKTVEEAPHLIVLSPDTFPEEEILLWSLGLEDHGVRGPRAALLYGRGRQFGPVLEGESLTREALLRVLSMVDMKCGCDTDFDWLLGTVIPRKWGQELRARVAKELGFDPDNPMVKMEVSQLWSGVGAAQDEVGGVFAYSEGEMVDWDKYLQSAVPPDQAPETAAAALTAPHGKALASASESGSPLGKRIGRVILIVVMGMLLLVLGGSALVLSRARQKKTSP